MFLKNHIQISTINKYHHHWHKSTVWTCVAMKLMCSMCQGTLETGIAPAYYTRMCYKQGTWDLVPMVRTVWFTFSFIT